MSNSKWMVVLNRSPENELVKKLSDNGYCVMASPDIYDMPSDNVVGSAVNEYDGEVIVCADYELRAIESIMTTVGVDRKFSALPTSQMNNDAIISTIGDMTGPLNQDECEGTIRDFHHTYPRRWYPIIDPQRCKNCKACVEFCLFGVFELRGSGDCFVAIPDNCKTGCPSCSRVCPEGAIIFPRYPAGGAIAGGDGEIEIQRADQARQMGSGDVQLYKDTYGDSDDGDAKDAEMSGDLDDLESFDT